MFHVKQFVKPIIAMIAVALAVSPVAFAENIYDDSRYNNSAPASTVEDFMNGVTEGITEKFNDTVKAVQDFYNGYVDWTEEQAKKWEYYADYNNFLPENLQAWVYAQRIKDLVDYANGSTTGLTTGQNVYSFIAKRKLITGSQNGELTYELDTLYVWIDYNHTVSQNFTGITIGNFFLQPNTFYCTRQFSNGDFDAFYGDTKQFGFYISNESSNYVNVPFYFTFNAGQTYTIYNMDGTTESLTFKTESTAAQNSSLRFKILDNNLNAIAEDDFYRQMQYYPSAGQYISNGRLTNIQLICNNATKSDGSMMRPNNYAGSADGWDSWYLSSGAFIGNSNNSLTIVPRSFTTTNDPTNYDPRKPPAVLNPDPLLLTDTQLTPQNVNNYSDYGITYNSTNLDFELDVNALAAGIAGQLIPEFQGVFDLVYDSQPDIGGNDWTNLNNNYNLDYDNAINDISVIMKDLLPVEPWQEPSFPALETNPLVDYTYPTLPTQTVPQNVIDDVGTVLDIGFDCIDVLDIAGILIALAVFGAVGYYIWG